MTENSPKNMRILIMVLRGACTESLDIPQYRLYSIFPQRQIANTKDEQSSGEKKKKSYIFLLGCLPSITTGRKEVCVASSNKDKHSKQCIGSYCKTALGVLDLMCRNKLN